MDPHVVQEMQETEEEKDREEQEKKETMEEDGEDETEEQMEEDGASERREPEEGGEEEKMEGGEGEERAEDSYLEPEEGEEEGEEEVDPERVENLLEEEEVGQENHDMDSEDILRNFVKSDNTSNSGLGYQSFPELTINSPKDNLSDDENNCHTLAYDPYSSDNFNECYNYSTKPEGSTLNYQDEPAECVITSSITDPHDTVNLGADEEQEVEEQEGEQEEQEKEDSRDEDVLYAGEVKVDEKEQEIIVEEQEIIVEEKEITTEGGGRTGLGGRQVANKDCRTQYKEVTKALSLSL